MLLILFLLAPFFTTQEQAPVVEVLDVEVLRHEVKPRRNLQPLGTPPPGPIYAEDIPGRRRETSRTERPTIETRSRELNQIGKPTRQEPQQPVAGGPLYRYEYRVKIKNTSLKKVKSLLWEYQVTDASGTLSQRHFLCPVSIKPDEVKVLSTVLLSPPSRVINADTAAGEPQHKAVVNRVEYTDGSTWIRDRWKQDEASQTDASVKERDLRDGRCRVW